MADASKPETLTKAINEVKEEFRTPDVLPYNIGVTEPDGDQEITCQLLLEGYQINVVSAYHYVNLVVKNHFSLLASVNFQIKNHEFSEHK